MKENLEKCNLFSFQIKPLKMHKFMTTNLILKLGQLDPKFSFRAKNGRFDPLN